MNDGRGEIGTIALFISRLIVEKDCWRWLVSGALGLLIAASSSAGEDVIVPLPPTARIVERISSDR